MCWCTSDLTAQVSDPSSANAYDDIVGKITGLHQNYGLLNIAILEVMGPHKRLRLMNIAILEVTGPHQSYRLINFAVLEVMDSHQSYRLINILPCCKSLAYTKVIAL